MKNFLSFDVEEWFVPLDPEPGNWDSYPSRIVEEVEHILDILERHQTKATFFILTQSVLRYPQLVKGIAKRGHEIASHGTRHHFVYNQTPQQFRADLDESIGFLRKQSNKEILGYRAPYFSITKRSLWALPILKEAGFRYDSSIFPIYNYRYGIPNAPRYPHMLEETRLAEFPPSTHRIAGLNMGLGGVYFRLLPFGFIMRAIRKLNKSGHSTVLYLHPWEFDPLQPHVKCSAFLRLRHYKGLSQTKARLETLLEEFSFAPLREGLNDII